MRESRPGLVSILRHKTLTALRRQRALVLRLRNILDAVRGIPSALRVKAAGGRFRAVNILHTDKKIVFVSESPTVREAKLAFGLRRNGWDVTLLCKNKPGFLDLSSFSDVAQFGSSWEGVDLAHRTPSRLYHAFSTNYSDTMIRLVENKPGRVIVDFYDYFFSVADGLPDATRKHSLDIKAQTLCAQKADAICCRDMQMQYRRRDTHIGRGKPLVLFPEYCWDTEPLTERRAGGEVHIVQAGWMGFETRGDFDSGCLYVFREFAKAGCHIHVYLHPSFPQPGSPQFDALFADYLQLGRDTGRVHLHPSVPASKLVSELALYDYGFGMSNALTFDMPWQTHNPDRFPFCGSSRMIDCLDAGLGLLLNKAHAYMLHLFGRYGVFTDGAAVIHSGQIREMLLQRPSREQFLAARKALSIERNSARLIAFYEKLR